MNRHVKRLLAILLIAVFVAIAAPTGAMSASAPPSNRIPVIFIPGVGGTELYNRGELVWINPWKMVGSQLPILSLWNMNWMLPLRLASDGATPYDQRYEISKGDIMRHSVTDAYSGLISALKVYGYVEGRDLRVFPYDWRKDPGAATGDLGRLVEVTLKQTGARQVILIGHSQGGLIARDYVVSGGAPHVKATISLATPWLGTPTAYKALEYGWDLGVKLPGTPWAVMAPRDVKMLVKNYPAVYALTPGSRYFDWYPKGYVNRQGRDLSYKDSFERAIAPHNQTLAKRAPTYQDRLLNGQDYGVMQFIFAGTGRSTVAGYAEWKDWFGFTQKAERYTDGDEVVPLHSADLGFSKDEKRAEGYVGKVVSVGYVSASHTLFSQSPAVQKGVLMWLDVIHGRRPPGEVKVLAGVR